jgi:hypothetical protein
MKEQPITPTSTPHLDNALDGGIADEMFVYPVVLSSPYMSRCQVMIASKGLATYNACSATKSGCHAQPRLCRRSTTSTGSASLASLSITANSQSEPGYTSL